MVTFAQAQERAEEWINGELPAYQHREVRVREFELGFVVWAEDRADGPRSDGGAHRLVIARDSGEATLWPALAVGEVIRRYEEEYGRPETDEEDDVAPAPPARVDLNQTSFLLTPPEWLQEAADRIGIPDRRESSGGERGERAAASSDTGGERAAASSDTGGAVWPSAGAEGAGGAPDAPAGATPWAGTDTNADAGEDRSVPLPDTVFAPQLSEDDGTPPPPPAAPEAKTALMSGGSQLPPTALAPAVDESAGSVPGASGPGTPGSGVPKPGAPASGPPATAPGVPMPPAAPATHAATPPPGVPQAPGRPLAPNAGDIADAATSKAPPPRRGGGAGAPPPPQAAPPVPGAPGASGASAGGYVPTQMVPSLGGNNPIAPQGPPTPPPPPGPADPSAPPAPPGTPPGGVHHAATMLADPGRTGGGAPPPPAAAPAPGPQGAAGGARGAVHHAETVLAAPAPAGGPGVPPPPGAVPPPPPGAVPPPAAYGYPQPPQGLPTVGPGYQAVLRYRAHDGSEQQVIRRSAPGTPHPEWQIFHELRAMNVPPDRVLELHTELESCELPGAYCARMIREQWPQARITSIAPYGTDHGSRQQGMGQLLAHQGELHQVADGPARPAPVRAPLPQVQPVPPVPPEAIGQELAGAFGPGVFRFEQAAVSRQGVPPVVAHTLVAAGLPLDMGPFFWAQAQPGRPVPTLAELAAERGVQPAPDAGSYLVVGSDFGKAVCVQYGTAAIVAVPVEAGPGGAPVPPQFVNSSLPEFARCLALLGRMWRLRFGLNQEQAGRWTVDFQAQLASLDPAALGSPESWWSVLLEQMWDGLL
ncbi:SUKH-4 family immunity protein [Streptomyces sp. NPDC003717]|uniref:SUKH-4 family immunity protein n=1 Tax=Streptomyces sp. NPDC003717 TaxID=3154276 RepID=UPI0033BD03CB